MTDTAGSREEEGEAATRLQVRDAVYEPARPVCVVTRDEPVAVVAECLSENAGVNTAPVVDANGRLLGIIPMRLLLNDLFLRIAPEEFLADLADTDGLEEFGRISRAETAGALMEPPAYVTHDDDAREAFALMHERRIEGLPIVDSEMKVVGYLDRLHLVRLWLEHYKSSG
ncbi:MAG TPA: CBS domain-containing protein [Dehalococcoidia bacterium]|jgi:CBS domain-containing protein|nr:CBS domain-containing protein [Dehalococcoidia bacterium]